MSSNTILKRNPLFSSEVSSNKIYNKFGNLIKATDDLRDVGCNEIVNLPKIVVLGTQSSGKSSVLESIIGIDCLPRGDGVVTRRPLELRLIHIPYQDKIAAYAIFEEIKDQKFTDFSIVKEKIIELTEKVAGKNRNIVNNPIKLNIYSNTCPDLTLIDLPGITRIPIHGSDQPSNILEITSEMAKSFCADESTIILCVIPANIDISTSEALQMAMKLDPTGDRTIGVITKIDIMDIGTNAKKILLCEEVKLKLGFIAMKNRSQKDINEHVSVEDALKREKEFFSNHSVYRTMDKSYFGTDNLVERMKSVFMNHLKKFLPQVYATVKEKLKDCQENLDMLGTGLNSLFNENNKLSFVNCLINEFSEKVEKLLSGKLVNLTENNLNLQIRTLYIEFLNSFRNNYNPSKYIDDESLRKLLKKSEGIEISGFPSSRMIFILLDKDLSLVNDDIEKFYSTISDLVNEATNNLLFKIFSRFPKLCDYMVDVTKKFINNNYNITRELSDNIVAMNLNYIYIDDKVFNYEDIINKTVLKNNSGDQTENYYENLAEYTKTIIDYYFSVIIRNLREYIPKTWGNFFVKGIKEKLRGYCLSEICKVDFDLLLEEDPEVARKREYYSNLYKILKNSEKIMLSDNEIKLIIKENYNKTEANNLSIPPNILQNKVNTVEEKIKIHSSNTLFGNNEIKTQKTAESVMKNIDSNVVNEKLKDTNNQINKNANVVNTQNLFPTSNSANDQHSKSNVNNNLKTSNPQTNQYTIDNIILKDESAKKTNDSKNPTKPQPSITITEPAKNQIDNKNIKGNLFGDNNDKTIPNKPANKNITQKLFGEEAEKTNPSTTLNNTSSSTSSNLNNTSKKTNLFGSSDDKNPLSNANKKPSDDPLSKDNKTQSNLTKGNTTVDNKKGLF